MDNKAKILDIAMNLNRIGNWAADDYQTKKERINLFLNETTELVKSLDAKILQSPFRKTFQDFVKDYFQLEKIGKQGPEDQLFWAEQMMTWGNILTHRSKLI